MFKVWGGGIYELDEFYEIADELGILIWQVNCRNMIQGSRSWQPFGESKNVLKIYINIFIQAQNFAPSRNFCHPENIYFFSGFHVCLFHVSGRPGYTCKC